jgi:hypothetical protein
MQLNHGYKALAFITRKIMKICMKPLPTKVTTCSDQIVLVNYNFVLERFNSDANQYVFILKKYTIRLEYNVSTSLRPPKYPLTKRMQAKWVKLAELGHSSLSSRGPFSFSVPTSTVELFSEN